jgi:hypothetical protein
MTHPFEINAKHDAVLRFRVFASSAMIRSTRIDAVRSR